MWTLASDPSGGPKLPGTNSCGGPGCRAVATINTDGIFSLNRSVCPFLSGACFPQLTTTVYVMAQASKAVIPRDAGGPWARRIKVSLGGTRGWALRVSAFVTGRANPADWLRYSLVVLNCA